MTAQTRKLVTRTMQWMVPVEHRHEMVEVRFENGPVLRNIFDLFIALPGVFILQIRRTFHPTFVAAQAILIFIAALSGPPGPWFLIAGVASLVLVVWDAYIDQSERTLGEPFSYGMVGLVCVVFCEYVFTMRGRFVVTGEFLVACGLTMLMVGGWRLAHNVKLPQSDTRTDEERYEAAIRLIAFWWVAAFLVSAPTVNAVPGSAARDATIGSLLVMGIMGAFYTRRAAVRPPTKLSWVRLVSNETRERLAWYANMLMRPVKRDLFLVSIGFEVGLFLVSWSLPPVAFWRSWTGDPMASQTDWLIVWRHIGGMSLITIVWIYVHRANYDAARKMLQKATKPHDKADKD